MSSALEYINSLLRKAKPHFLRACVLFVAGFMDSIRFPSLIKRYFFNRRDETSKIRQIMLTSWKYLLIYFFATPVAYQLIKTYVPNYVTYIFYAVIVLPCWIGLMVYMMFYISDIVVCVQAINAKPGAQNSNELRAAREESVLPRHSQQTLIANKLKKPIFIITYLLVCSVFVQVARLLPIGSGLLITALYAFYFAIFLFLTKWDYSLELLYYFEINASYFVGFGFVFSSIARIFTYTISDGLEFFVISDAVYFALFQIFCFTMMCSQPPLLPLPSDHSDDDSDKGATRSALTLNKFRDIYTVIKSLPQPTDTHIRSYTKHLDDYVNNRNNYRSHCKRLYLFQFTRWLTDIIGKEYMKFRGYVNKPVSTNKNLTKSSIN